MNWLNFLCADIRSDSFSEATEEQVGVWFRLVNYCCEQENQGIIIGADKWGDKKSITATGVPIELIKKPSPLWHFSPAGSLCVDHYPDKKEQEVKAKRVAGKRTAELRWGKLRKKSNSKNSSAISSARSSVNAEGEGEGERNTLIPSQALRVVNGKSSH